MRRRFFNDCPFVPEHGSSSEKSRPVVEAVFRHPLSGAEAGAIARRLKKEFVLFDGLLLPRILSLFVNAQYVLCNRCLARIAGED